MARVNQPLISQSARELRAKEKASWPRVEQESCSAGRFMIVSNFISSMREGIMLFFFFSPFPRSEILLITSATKSILDKRIGNVSVNRWNAWNHR